MAARPFCASPICWPGGAALLRVICPGLLAPLAPTSGVQPLRRQEDLQPGPALLAAHSEVGTQPWQARVSWPATCCCRGGRTASGGQQACLPPSAFCSQPAGLSIRRCSSSACLCGTPPLGRCLQDGQRAAAVQHHHRAGRPGAALPKPAGAVHRRGTGPPAWGAARQCAAAVVGSAATRD